MLATSTTTLTGDMDAFYGIATPIFAVDENGIVVSWNHKMQEVTGFTHEKLLGQSLTSLLNDGTSWEGALSRVLSPNIGSNSRSDNSKCTISIRDRDSTRSFEVRVVSNCSHSENRVVGAICFADPVIENDTIIELEPDDLIDHAQQYNEIRKEAKTETEQKLTAYFAHELRNPLSALDSALTAIPSAKSDEVLTIISEMQACIKGMSSIMNNLVDLRKFEEGTISLNLAPLQLSSVVSEVHRILLPSVKPGVSFTVECNTNDRDWVRGDARRLQQTLINVTSNAIKYTLGGSVTLKACWDADAITFLCHDTGPLIVAMKRQEILPESFYHCGAPNTGIEITVAKQLVKLAGGTITFESVRKSELKSTGNFCFIKLPLAVCETNLICSIPKAELIETRLRFLIVDDIKMNRTMMKRRFEKSVCSQCLVSEASTGEEAIQMCAVEHFDVIVVDQYMDEAGGVMVGTDAIYALRRMGVNSIIIGCSGNDLDDEFIDAGADAVWPKPIPTNEEIIRQISEALAYRDNPIC